VRTLGYLLLLVFATSCGKNEEYRNSVPDGILPQAQLADLLVDFSLAESSSNLNIKRTTIQKVDSVYSFDPLAEHGIRKSQYDSTLDFYSHHPDLYRNVYDSVLVKLADLKIRTR
jgi:hypothetical protein